MKMVFRLLAGVLAVGLIGASVGVSVSAFRHYYHKYSDEEGLKSAYVQEVVIVEDETKKRRGKK